MSRIGTHALARRVTVVALVAAVLGSAGIALATSSSPPARAPRGALPSVVAAVEAARRGAPIPDRLSPPIARIKLFPPEYRIPPVCYSHNASTAKRIASRVCRVGRVSSKRLIVLLGDSHAFMWLPAVLELARRDGWAVVPLIRFGCTPGQWYTDVGSDRCRAWLRWSMRQIRRLDPDVVLLGASIGERPSPTTLAATTGTIEAARRLRALGRVVVIGDPEGLAGDPVPCVTARHATMANCTTTWPTASLRAYDTVARATQRLRVGFIRTRGLVCYRRQCPAVVGRTLVWMDNSHLTGRYSAQVAGPFGSAFRLVVR